MSFRQFISWGKLTAFILIAIAAFAPANSQDVQTASDVAHITALKQKLQSIMIDKVNFDKLDIGTVLEFLSQKSKELDPEKQGINFVLRIDPGTGTAAKAPHRAISLTLDNISLADLLNEIVAQTGLTYSVDAYAVYVRPASDQAEALTVRTFLVPAGFFTGSSPDNANSASPAATQKFLESKGIVFPDGATATYLSQSNKLVVRNTPAQLDLIEALLSH